MIKTDILECMNCGMRKHVVSTGLPSSMMHHVEITSHCCKKPVYNYDPKFSFVQDN